MIAIENATKQREPHHKAIVTRLALRHVTLSWDLGHIAFKALSTESVVLCTGTPVFCRTGEAW